MLSKISLLSIALLFLLFACNKAPDTSVGKSDPEAVQIAEDLIEACGGQANWDSTRYITWRNLGGKRRLVWDKWTGNIRVENMITLVLMNLNTKEGRAWQYGEEITDPERLQRALEFAYESWAYDSYAVFLPFMLLNEGIILKYLGEGQVNDRPVDVLQVTFDNVGPTPEAKYHLHIDKESKLLVQWDYYMDVTDQHPRFKLPWLNYKKYGGLLLSDDRGAKNHPGLAVFDELPASIFTSPEPVKFDFEDPAFND
ncbi:MAG: hypothetical protein GWN30_35600 [Gammaproteobacteria bacterium]|nr:hypothetical protein [Gammaproteobacteria bacterium]NIW98145.1 hypothetical protein [Phycisphaerae bacterium]